MKKILSLLIALIMLWPVQLWATDYVTKTSTSTGNFEFSTDGDLGSSDTIISSQQAIKTYVDTYSAPASAYLITTRNVAALTNASNLGSLSTGLLKVTVSGGVAVLSVAVDGDDYLSAAATLPASLLSIYGLTETNGGLLYGTADNTYAWLAAGTSGYFLQGNGAGAPSWVNHTGAADPHTGYVLESLFDANTIIAATSDNTPAAVTVAEQTLIGRITGGNIDDLSATQVRTLLNVADGANAYVHPNHSGDVTSVADGATTIANKAVTLAKMDDMATASVIYRKTAGAGAPEVNTIATLKTDMSLGNVQNLKYKMDATEAPAVTNDVDEGYSVGSRWFDVTNDKEYVCLDATDGAAVWTETTGAGGGAGDVATDAIWDAAGDLVVGTGANTAARLAKGTAHQMLKMNSDASAIEWSTTLTSPVLTTPQINDTSADHQYVFVASELAADRNVTLPLLGAADEFMFKTHHKASSADITTGTEDNKYVTPDGLAGSNYGKRIVMLKLVDDATALAIGDGKIYFPIPTEMNDWNLVGAHAMVSTVSSSGTPTYQIYNVTQTADMLSTRITIDANEATSYTAATAPVIDTGNDDVATGDVLRIDKDVAGTGEKGDTIILVFQLP